MTTRNRPRDSRISTQRRQAARWQRERRRQRWLLVFAAVVLLIVVAIPAYGYYTTFVAPPRRAVVTVNGVKRTLGDLAKLTRANAAIATSMGEQPQLGTLPFQVLIDLVNEELILQVAPTLGIVVTQDDVDAGLRDRFYPRPPEGEQTDPDALEREFREKYRQYLNFSQLSDREYRQMVRVSLLQYKIRELMGEQIPGVEEQVYVHWIRVSDQSVLEEIQEQVDKGEAFDRLARIYSTSGPYADDNGEVGWVPRGAFPDMDEILFSIEHDTVSQPIMDDQLVYYLVKVTDGPELREVSEGMREVLKTRALEQWLDEERGKNDVSVSFGSSEYEWVVDKVQEIIPASTTS